MAVSQEMMKGTVLPIILKLLSEKAMYGYEMIQVVNERTDGVLAWKEGTLYPWLHRLEQEGLVQSFWEESAGGRRRKYYALTHRGAAEMTRQVAGWHSLSRAVSVVLAHPLPT
ncbi:MAG: helix-turn-helix transcriptional regulator [Lentisphaeria bacterium]|nr:helix-turn-helix transcriptional regulator [Lentisphaeria bacterium]